MNARERMLAIVIGTAVALLIGWKLILSPIVAKAGELL